MIMKITVKEISFWNGHLINVIRNVPFTFYLSLCRRWLKKILENALKYETAVVLNILPLQFS